MSGNHADPAGDAVDLHFIGNATVLLRHGPLTPVHHHDYTVMRSPLSAFLNEADRIGLGDRIVHCGHGGHATLPAAPGAVPVVR
ncbi:hypothetical protein ACF08B_22855 [Streptomyces sp. NPDC015139]|uniref:hypothetical protein n=1 Tax=Streptomyces sp. NPDC015139 TaxID=3364942 RepID=UPI0036F86029